MPRREFLGSFAILAGLAAAGTFFAAWAYPLWDDAYWELMSLDQRASQIAETVADRPLAGEIWQWMIIDRGTFFPKAIAIHWLICFGTALFTWYLARRLFPGRSVLALSTACLAATPFLCRTQLVLATHPIAPALSSVTAFLATFLVDGTIRRSLPSWNLAVRWLAAAGLLTAGGLTSEYFVASTLAGIVGIVSVGWGLETAARRRSFRSSLVLAALMVAVYLIYHQVASAEARPGVRPEEFLTQDLGWRAKVTLPVWISSVYTACVGAVFERIGSLRLQNGIDVAALAAGAVVAIMIQGGFAGRKDGVEQAPSDGPQPALLIGLILGLALGLLPMVVMGRRPDLSMLNSRFWAPLVPYALCASIGLLALLLRPNRFWLLPPACGFLAGWSLVSDGLPAHRELQRVAAWGTALRDKMCENGLCVAVFENGWQSDERVPNDYELTARITGNWSAAERERFWAMPNFFWTVRNNATSGIDVDHSLSAPEIHRSTRGISRRGTIRRVLWVFVSPDNELQIRAVDVE